jgi:hypothetical protein
MLWRLLSGTPVLSAKRSLEWSRVEHFIKHDLAWHVPSCNAIQVGADAATCAEHCVRCAFGGTDDPSRCQPCECEHALRCPNCAEVHSLREDFDLLLRSVDTALDRAETVARDSEEGDAAPSLQRMRDVRESVREVALLVSEPCRPTPQSEPATPAAAAHRAHQGGT